jgi:hypothetical protein
MELLNLLLVQIYNQESSPWLSLKRFFAMNSILRHLLKKFTTFLLFYCLEAILTTHFLLQFRFQDIA